MVAYRSLLPQLQTPLVLPTNDRDATCMVEVPPHVLESLRQMMDVRDDDAPTLVEEAPEWDVVDDRDVIEIVSPHVVLRAPVTMAPTRKPRRAATTAIVAALAMMIAASGLAGLRHRAFVESGAAHVSRVTSGVASRVSPRDALARVASHLRH